jgi:glycosyltransferase involved in cell wall biosynthesis
MTSSTRILFVINEDWFFVSHFRHVAQAAQARGHEVRLACRASVPPVAAVDIALPLRARGRSAAALWQAGRAIRQASASWRPDLVHAFGLVGITMAGLAFGQRTDIARVNTVTGLGMSGAGSSLRSRLVLTGLRQLLHQRFDTPRTRWTVENLDDARRLGLDTMAAGPPVLVPGAGVDLPEMVPPLPPTPPLRVCLVARMIRSKGIDTAVAAVALARAQGVPVELTLIGAPDVDNPASFSTADLTAMAMTGGVDWVGRKGDIPERLGGFHAFVLPSRGGEGLPLSLLEAAAAGRALIVSDVPGCRDFAGDGRGILVPPDDPPALAKALAALAADPGLVARLGAAARQHAQAGHSRAVIAGLYLDVYDALLGTA